MVPATGTATFEQDSVPMARKAAMASTQPPMRTAQASGTRRSAKDRAFMIRAENRRLRCSLSTERRKDVERLCCVCHMLPYNDQRTPYRLMKIPFRLLFGLVLGLGLGYSLSLLARPATSLRNRRRSPPRAQAPRDARERVSVH